MKLDNDIILQTEDFDQLESIEYRLQETIGNSFPNIIITDNNAKVKYHVSYLRSYYSPSHSKFKKYCIEVQFDVKYETADEVKFLKPISILVTENFIMSLRKKDIDSLNLLRKYIKTQMQNQHGISTTKDETTHPSESSEIKIKQDNAIFDPFRRASVSEVAYVALFIYLFSQLFSFIVMKLLNLS